jgi:hypothetical protein
MQKTQSRRQSSLFARGVEGPLNLDPLQRKCMSFGLRNDKG